MINIELGFWADRKPNCVILIRRENTERSDLAKSLVHEYEKLGKKERRKYPVYQVSNDGTIDQSLSLIHERLRDLGLEFSASRNNKSIQKSLLDNGNGKFSQKKTNDLAPLVPTEVYETYWRFAFLRQEIFFRRFAGETVCLTTDPVLSQYKFTNPYRAADRVSQYLIRNVIYTGDQSINEVFFRTLLFKLFNRISTWELFRGGVGKVELKTYAFQQYDGLLTRAIEKGERIYSSAYIMPSGGRNSDYDRKHRMHLKLLEQMIEDELPEKLSNCTSMGDAFLLLRAYPTLGDFLAYQYVTDVNYSEITNFTEMEFVVAGPGARNGIRKCFVNLGGLNDAEIIRLVTERQDVEFKARGLNFQSLFGRKLQLIDCQNLFCEVDKYARVMHPEFSGTDNRKRIKQKFHLNSEPIEYWFPPKWNINENIEKRVENYARI